MTDHALEMVAKCAADMRDTQTALRAAVRCARELRWTWDAIGFEIGCDPGALSRWMRHPMSALPPDLGAGDPQVPGVTLER